MASSRRELLQSGAAVGLAGAVLAAPRGASARAKTVRPRRLALHNLHTDERLEAVYFEHGRYCPHALKAVNHVLRDFRTGEVRPIHPALLDLLHNVSARVESRGPFEIISAYRSPKTNAMLHETTPGVATRSLHMDGMAADIRLPGLELSTLHRAALSLERGGVGYYPSSDFVHVDVGPVRRWD